MINPTNPIRPHDATATPAIMEISIIDCFFRVCTSTPKLKAVSSPREITSYFLALKRIKMMQIIIVIQGNKILSHLALATEPIVQDKMPFITFVLGVAIIKKLDNAVSIVDTAIPVRISLEFAILRPALESL